MATREDILREKTYKEEGEQDILRRVFYTLHDGKKDNLQDHRNSKALAELIRILFEKKIIDEKDMDDILLEAID